MMMTRYAVCSQSGSKPVTRIVCDTKPEAERALARIKELDAAHMEAEYWIAELGPECEAWRWLTLEKVD